ncbi:hypothetical protein [Spectribacter hydrogenoxidans]|uniref:C2H2-type domain-containing protein n=1 Tax=Spectribacter hydrogenoxidans TaxID=3075608 RepID=A0ABU3BXU9_9GAMM|nr:hypothetical protein [Salinisphaera sp. W335]MDT0634113.1 hypothetical protein [Salinisphaera sp. W335]
MSQKQWSNSTNASKSPKASNPHPSLPRSIEMPFQGEPPGRLSQGAIASNPEFQAFLKSCEPIEGPDPEATSSLLAQFKSYEPDSFIPDHLLAVDGGEYVSSVSEHFPSREILHIRIGSVLLDLAGIRQIQALSETTVDPFEVQKIQQDTSALTLWFPGANIVRGDARSPQQGFRACLREAMVSEETRLNGRLLLDTIYEALAARALAEGGLSNYDPSTEEMLVTHCPSPDCAEERLDQPVRLARDTESAPCPRCQERVYATDALRLHEAFSDHQGNQGLVSRTRNLCEHLLLLHYLLYLQDQNPNALSEFGFVMDGPLAIFGEGARFHRSLMRVISNIYERAETAQVPPPVIFGVQKSGAVLEFAQSLDRVPRETSSGESGPEVAAEQRAGAIPNGTVLSVTDDIRFTYITPKSEANRSIHGYDTYYGQDLIVKTHAGRLFVVNVAYPFGSKGTDAFKHRRFDLEAYPGLGRSLGVLEAVESGLYGNSTVPQMLAHRFSSISRVPGGKILDILAQRHVGSNRER